MARLFLLDSGCTWHCHNVLEDLVNVRSVRERIDDANGNVAEVTTIGDLPLRVRDSEGNEHRLLIPDVRFVPTFVDSLLSTDQLWETSGIKALFHDAQVARGPRQR